jgi:hypothetical protein
VTVTFPLKEMQKSFQPSRDSRIAEEMKKNGVPCHSKALFFALTALAAKEAKSEIFGTKVQVRDTLSNKIAAKLVYDFLRRNELRITLQILQNEGDLRYFSKINHESIDALKFRENKPPIQKLAHMRYSKVPKIDQDDLTTGWFDIDSDMERTITMDGVSGPFRIDSGAWERTTIQSEEEKEETVSGPKFSPRKLKELTAREIDLSPRKRRDYSIKTEEPQRPPIRLHNADVVSTPVQLIPNRSGSSSGTYEDGSGRIVPSVRSSSSGRRGRRTEEDN